MSNNHLNSNKSIDPSNPGLGWSFGLSQRGFCKRWCGAHEYSGVQGFIPPRRHDHTIAVVLIEPIVHKFENLKMALF